MLIINARVYTLDARNSIAEAVAILNNTIEAVGSTADLRERYARERVIDARGASLLPGLVDAHAHLSNLARSKLGLNVDGERSPQAIRDQVAAYADGLASGEWVTGRGWDQNLWPDTRFPTRELLDSATATHPVALTRVDGHATWVNTMALRAAGISAATEDPAGGRVYRSDDGEPTGILIDAAQHLVRRVMPAPSEARMLQAIGRAIEDCLKVGLTEVHEMGLDRMTISLYKRLIDRGEFPFRVYGAVGGRGETWDEYRERGPEVGYGDDRLSIRSLKLVADGALGSRGAALLEPYSDDPENCGLTIIPEDVLNATCLQAAESGFQVCTHAIGDRTNRQVLNAYEQTFARRPAGDYRFRVEHAQILTASDLPRFKQLNVLPSMQASHCTSDMPWAGSRLGEARLAYAYAWRSLLDSGIPILGGSDFPVESPNPFLGIYASVTRQPANASTATEWNPAQCMTREEALRSYTTWAAYGAFEEHRRGQIAAGYSADLVLLPADPFTVPAAELPLIQPLLTIVDGQIVYRAEAAAEMS